MIADQYRSLCLALYLDWMLRKESMVLSGILYCW